MKGSLLNKRARDHGQSLTTNSVLVDGPNGVVQGNASYQEA